MRLAPLGQVPAGDHHDLGSEHHAKGEESDDGRYQGNHGTLPAPEIGGASNGIGP